MKKELLLIENGEIEVRGNKIFYDLFLQIYKSEILGIVFDNTIERKYLLELFRGERILNGGRITIENNIRDFDSSILFFKNHTAVIEKKSKLIDNLSIAQNIFLFVEDNYFISERRHKRNFKILLKKFGLDYLINRSTRELLPKERIIIELLKAYYEDKKLVILSYISSILLTNDYQDIRTLLLKLTEYGMSFILIDTFNNVVFEWVNRYYLIGNGQTTKVFDSNLFNKRQLYSLLTRKVGLINNDKINNQDNLNSTSALEFKNIYTSHIKNFSFKVRPGEILKIIYLDDESCEHITDLLRGNIKPISGEIKILNRNINIKSISHAHDNGVCFIEESPYENMLFYNMTLGENLGLALSEKVPFFWFRKSYKRSILTILESFNLEEYAHFKLHKLDPQIIQVVAYLRWYLYAPNVVICIKPFIELDIRLQEITIDIIQRLKSRGIAVILLSPIFSETYKIETHTLYIKDGKHIDKDDVYQTLYKNNS